MGSEPFLLAEKLCIFIKIVITLQYFLTYLLKKIEVSGKGDRYPGDLGGNVGSTGWSQSGVKIV